MSERAFVSMGSNLGDREAHLESALDALRETAGVGELSRSSLWETAPVGPPGQGPYLNAVVAFETSLPPRALLVRLLEIEAKRGRVRSGVRNAARTLDLDLLFHGSRSVDEPGLRVPHPRLHERSFVLAPLVELAPDWIHPELGVSTRELAARLEAGGSWKPEEVVRWPSSP